MIWVSVKSNEITILTFGCFFNLISITDQDVTYNGIPQVKYFGTFGKHKVLVTSKTGPTLASVWEDADFKLRIETIYKVAIKAVSSIPIYVLKHYFCFSLTFHLFDLI